MCGGKKIIIKKIISLRIKTSKDDRFADIEGIIYFKLAYKTNSKQLWRNAT